MKKYVRLQNIKPLLIFIFGFTILSATLANDNSNYIIITGQVINTVNGTPLNDHYVYIESEQLSFSTSYYFKILETNEEGFFFDTISTNIDYGAFEVYTFDHDGYKESELLHFRIMDFTNSNSFLVNFHVYMPSQTPVLQARYRYIKKTTGDKFRYKFVDETQNNNIKSWLWDFGDGTTSTLADPEHFFPEFGMYKVNLIVIADVDDEEVKSHISKYIYIPQVNYYHIGGHCIANQFPIDNGYAFLYQVDENDVLIPFDTTSLNDTLGHYYFYQVPEGRYCLKAQPDTKSEYYGIMVPTYYGDSEYWKHASIISHNHTDYEYHINLVEGSGLPNGDGKIAGNVTFTSSDKDVNAYSSVGVPVYLLDALNNPMSYQYTDEDGSFSFDKLALGTYWIYPEVAGFNLTKEAIELTEIIPEVQDIEIQINADAVYLIFPDLAELEDNFVGYPYPNPASNQISFEINTKNSKDLKLDVVDVQGKVLISEILSLMGGVSKNTIQTSVLTPGIYFVRLHANGITSERKIMISR